MSRLTSVSSSVATLQVTTADAAGRMKLFVPSLCIKQIWHMLQEPTIVKFVAEASRLHPAWPSTPVPRASDEPAPAEASAPAKGKAHLPAAAAQRNTSKATAPAAAGKGSKAVQALSKGQRPVLGQPAKSVHEVCFC